MTVIPQIPVIILDINTGLPVEGIDVTYLCCQPLVDSALHYSDATASDTARAFRVKYVDHYLSRKGPIFTHTLIIGVMEFTRRN